MSRASSLVVPLALIASLAFPGCTAVQQLAAPRTVTFAFAGVTDAHVAGIHVGHGSSYAALGLADATRLGAAVVAGDVPLEMVVHVRATNPPESAVSARMTDLDWALFIEDRRAVAGLVGTPVDIAPGRSADLPLSVRLNLLELGSGGARDLFDLALAVAGYGSLRKDMYLELAPTLDTSLGPIPYPAPVIVRRIGPSR